MIRLIILLSAIFFLPAVIGFAETKWQPELRVGLFSASSATLNFSLPIEKGGVNLPANTPIVVSIEGGKIKIGDKIIDDDSIELRPKFNALIREMFVSIDGMKYPGTVKLVLRNNQLTIVNLTTTDEYLRGVIPNEMPTSWSGEALKTQTIAARTFALKNRKRHAADGYDLCSTTHCQVYKDLSSAVESSDAAIEATFGEVLVYNGVLINATFHSDSGGRTENASDVWGGSVPYPVSVDEFDTKTYPWKKTIAVEEFVKQLGKDIGELKAIKLSPLEIGRGAEDRSSSGRVKRITLVGSKQTIEIKGEELRGKFRLMSTLFDMSIKDGEVLISGYGFGPGVGMSQYGTLDFSEHGRTYDAILKHYYTGAEIKKAYGTLPAWKKNGSD